MNEHLTVLYLCDTLNTLLYKFKNNTLQFIFNLTIYITLHLILCYRFLTKVRKFFFLIYSVYLIFFQHYNVIYQNITKNK